MDNILKDDDLEQAVSEVERTAVTLHQSKKIIADFEHTFRQVGMTEHADSMLVVLNILNEVIQGGGA